MNMKEIAWALKAYYKEAEEAERIIMECALMAGGATAVGSMVPVLSLPAAIMACFGAVWAMYIRLCKCLGITISKNILKVLASAALSNMATNLISVFAVELLLTFIPGVSTATSALVTFACVYLAGMMFMKMILSFAKRGKAGSGLGDLSEKELEAEIKNNTPSKKDVKDAKKEFCKNQK